MQLKNMFKNEETLKQTKLMLLTALVCFLSLWAALSFFNCSTLVSENAKHISAAYSMLADTENGMPWSKLLNTSTYPPLFYLNAVLFFKLFGFASESIALMSLSVYVIIASWSVYGLTKRKADALTSLSAAFITSALFSYSILIEGFLIEHALTALVPALFYFLTADDMPLKKRAFFISLCFAAGMLLKWNYFAYLLPAFLTAFINFIFLLISKKNTEKISSYALSLVFALLSLGIISLWYTAEHDGLSNFDELYRYYIQSRDEEIAFRKFIYGFRASCSGIAKWGPLCFVLYIFQEACPIYLRPLLAGGTIYAVYSLIKQIKSRIKLKEGVIFCPAAAALLTLTFSLASYGYFPNAELFIPESSLRYIYPLMPVGIYLSFSWLHILKAKQIFISGLMLFISALISFNWTFPYDSIFKNKLLVTPSFNALCTFAGVRSFEMPTVGAFQDPLGIFTAPKLTDLEILCRDLGQESKASQKEIAFKLINKEDFDPFLIALHKNIGSVPVISAEYERSLYYFNIDSMRTMQLLKDPDFARIISAERILSSDPNDISVNFFEIENNKIKTPENYVKTSDLRTVYRIGQEEIYMISEFKRK